MAHEAAFDRSNFISGTKEKVYTLASKPSLRD